MTSLIGCGSKQGSLPHFTLATSLLQLRELERGTQHPPMPPPAPRHAATIDVTNLELRDSFACLHPSSAARQAPLAPPALGPSKADRASLPAVLDELHPLLGQHLIRRRDQKS